MAQNWRCPVTWPIYCIWKSQPFLSAAEPSRQAPNKRRKRKMSGGSTISGGGGTNNNNNNKKKSPGSFPLSSQVPVSPTLPPSGHTSTRQLLDLVPSGQMKQWCTKRLDFNSRLNCSFINKQGFAAVYLLPSTSAYKPCSKENKSFKLSGSFLTLKSFFICLQDVMVVGEPTLMGGEFGDEDERLITRLENTQFDAANGIDDEDSFNNSPALGSNSPWNNKAPSSQESKSDNPTSQASQ